MKNILVLCATASLVLAAAQQGYAQSESTALDIASQHEARGSARYQALGGAMGAIGADFSSIQQNPAGISYFRSGNKLSLSLAHSTYGASSNWNGNNTDLSKKSALHLDEISYLGNFLTGSGVNVSYGVGIQNNGRIHRRTNALSTFSGETTSLADYATAVANNVLPGPVAPSATNPYNAGNPWIAALAYEAAWINYSKAENRYNSGYTSPMKDASLIIDQKGATSNIDFAIAAEFSSIWSIGASVSLTSFEYDYTSFYQEARTGTTLLDGKTQHYGLSLDNKVNVSGLGARLSAGFLVRPTESLRLGAAFYTPTIYTNIRMDYFARAVGLSPQYARTGAIETTTPRNGSTTFGMALPWRYTLSAAYIFGHSAILSADYEYQDFSSTRLNEATADEYYGYSSNENIYSEDNQAIKEDLGGQHTLRLGLEGNLSRRLAARIGYRYSTSPKYGAELSLTQAEVGMLTPGTNVHYRLPGSVQTYSIGLGYKLSPRWTLDITYSLREQHDKVAAFPYVRDELKNIRYFPLETIKDTQTQGNLIATISYRF